GEAPDWSMFQPDEHIHLFTEGSIRQLLERAGFKALDVRPSLFPYDMWVVASRGKVRRRLNEERLPAAFRSVLDLSCQISKVRGDLAVAETDRTARLGQIRELTGAVLKLEAVRREDTVARREDTDKLTALLRDSEADRAARLEQIEELTQRVRTVEAAH